MPVSGLPGKLGETSSRYERARVAMVSARLGSVSAISAAWRCEGAWGVERVDRKSSVATGSTAGAAGEVRAGAASGVGESGIDDLDQMSVLFADSSYFVLWFHFSIPSAEAYLDANVRETRWREIGFMETVLKAARSGVWFWLGLLAAWIAVPAGAQAAASEAKPQLVLGWIPILGTISTMPSRWG